MDRYVKMCEAAYEFQVAKRVAGDKLFLTNNLYRHGDELSVINNETEPVYKKGEYTYCEGLCDKRDEDVFLRQSIFLPSQENIQKKFKGPASYILTSFVNFIVPSRYGSLADKHDFSELWLMFFYFHVHGRVWNGQDWVKAQTTGDFFT